jgi:perosamine synthetase
MVVPLSASDIAEQDRHAVLEVLQSERLSLGPRLDEFERLFAERLGSRYAVGVNSGTSGLHLAVKGAGVSDGDEVVTSPFSFVASANCILFERGIPVFVDIDPVTYNIDPSRVEAAISPRTRAILPVHVFGRPCAIREILELAQHHGLTVIEDACEAIGACDEGKPVGTFGESGVFAFYPNKQITTGEGGMIITDDERIAALCRSWRNQGRKEDGGWLQHQCLGYNYRISEIHCALGISQLRRLDTILAARACVAAAYREALKDLPHIILPALPGPGVQMSWFVFVVRLQDEFTREHRDTVLAELNSRGIGCSNYFAPIHLQPFYQKEFGFRKGDFPITERIADRTIALPFFTRLSQSQIDYVCSALRQTLASLSARKLAAPLSRASA